MFDNKSIYAALNYADGDYLATGAATPASKPLWVITLRTASV